MTIENFLARYKFNYFDVEKPDTHIEANEAILSVQHADEFVCIDICHRCNNEIEVCKDAVVEHIAQKWIRKRRS